jgi:hypothetical protein
MICRFFAFFASILSHAIDIVKLLYNWKKKDFRMLDIFIFFSVACFADMPAKNGRGLVQTSPNMFKHVQTS